MGIILTKNTKLLIQGITGKEGLRATKNIINSGIEVIAGVTPTKGGQEAEGKPVYDSVAEAKKQHPEINTTVIFAPPLQAYDATSEAIANNIETIILIPENIPQQHTAKLIKKAKQKNITIIGPPTVGIIVPEIGMITAGGEEINYKKGEVGIISKSGGMTNETAELIMQKGKGISTAICIGGDPLIGSTYVDIIKLFEKDNETKEIVIYGEIGGTYEEELAEYIKKNGQIKPISIYISGEFAQTLTRNMALGHAGAILQEGKGTAQDKKKILKEAGIKVVEYHHELGG